MRESTLPPAVVRRLLGLVALGVSSPIVQGQGRGTYLNVESPQVSPIALANVGSRTVLLACNTPANTLELWDTDEAILPASARYLQSLRVGLEPVSVHVDDATDRFWTANFLGDSVSTGKIEIDGGSGLPRLRLVGTANVGDKPQADEPMDIALASGSSNTIFVTLHTGSALAVLDADTLAPVATPYVLTQNPNPSGQVAAWGIKEPRAVRVKGGRVYTFGFKGGVTQNSNVHDLDVLHAALTPTAPFIEATNTSLAGLGSTNFNARFASNGDLWVVGGEAKNFRPLADSNKIGIRSEPSGFVQSTLYRVRTPAGIPGVTRRDVNKRSNGTVVGKSNALAMPTDLALFEQAGRVAKVFVAAFSSDRIGVFVAPNPDTVPPLPISRWKRRVVNYATSAPVNGGSRWGPRGMTLGTLVTGPKRLYVLNRLDNSVTVFDPLNEVEVVSFALSPLAPDPTPAYVKQGRKFLYSADEGNGFVSCASCHTDGRTDALSWTLGNPDQIGPFEPPPTGPFLFGLLGVGSFDTQADACDDITVWGDGLFFVDMLFDLTTLALDPRFDSDEFPPDHTPEDKREMVTQSLQGLSNFEVAFDPGDLSPTGVDHTELVRRVFHNAPFHWRGDKPSLRAFNEAFVTLLGGENDEGTFYDARGLSEAEMDSFERFVHSITYPPNPQEPSEREFSDDDLDHPVYGQSAPEGYPGGFAGGKSGLRLFHTFPTILAGERSCAQCHTLPEGGNNRITVLGLTDPVINNFILAPNRQSIESAALRGLFQKEPLLEFDGNVVNSPTTPVVGHFGLNHNGVLPETHGNPAVNPDQNRHTAINTFVNVFFDPGSSFEARAMKQFNHEFDWGIGPIIGELVFVGQADVADATTRMQKEVEIAVLEAQAALANAGLVLWVERPDAASSALGYRYDPVTGKYAEENGSSITSFTLDELLAWLATLDPQDCLTALSVPLGNERRIAAPPTVPSQYLQLQPTFVKSMPMVPDTAYADVPSFRDNWVPLGAHHDILGGAVPFDFSTNDGMDDVFTKTIRLFQYGLLDGENSVDYGVSELRHEAPRRMRVSGANLVLGAKLLLSVPYPSSSYVGPPPSAMSDDFPVVVLELPLFPTNQTDPGNGNRPVWETAVEVEPFWAYALMLGGPRAPGVQAAIDTTICSELQVTIGNLNTCLSPPGIGSCGSYALPDPAVDPLQFIEPPDTAMPYAGDYDSPFAPDDWNWYEVRVRNPGPDGPDDPSGMVSVGGWFQLTM